MLPPNERKQILDHLKSHIVSSAAQRQCSAVWQERREAAAASSVGEIRRARKKMHLGHTFFLFVVVLLLPLLATHVAAADKEGKAGQ